MARYTHAFHSWLHSSLSSCNRSCKRPRRPRTLHRAGTGRSSRGWLDSRRKMIIARFVLWKVWTYVTRFGVNIALEGRRARTRLDAPWMPSLRSNQVWELRCIRCSQWNLDRSAVQCAREERAKFCYHAHFYRPHPAILIGHARFQVCTIKIRTYFCCWWPPRHDGK